MKWIRPEITKEVLDKWKEGLDLISNLVNIPAGLIMKTYPLEVEVLISSATLNNPYKTGQKFNLDTGLYCESIIAQHTQLIITNARKDPRWAQSPDVSLGMVSFFGLPLMWPDGEMFGVICLLDKKERNFSSSTQKIFLLFKKAIDSDLDLLLKMGEHKRSKDGLERLKEELELRVDARTEELKKLNQQMQIEISERRETEKKYRDLVEKEKDVIFTLDSEGICTWVSPKIHDLLGYNPEELLSKKFLSIIPEEWHEKTKADFDKVCQEQELTSETVVLNKQGERKFIEFSATAIKEGNKILGIRGIARDITERKRVEEQIRESSERLKYILDSIPAGIVIIKPDTFSIVDINPLALEMINTSKNKIIGAGCRDFLCPQDEGCCPVKDHNKKIFNQPCFLKKADGSKIPILKTTVPISLKGKEYLLEIFIDVTEQKKAEKALAASEAKYRNLIENSIEGIGIIKDGFYIYANNALLEIFDYKSFDEFIKIPPVETLSPEYRTLFQDRMKKSENGIPVSPVCEYKIIRRNGEIRDVEVSSSKLLIDDQSYYQATFRDVTWRKNWEKALQESEAKYSSLVEQAQEGVVIIQNGVLKFCNKAMSKITGYSLNELIGMDYLYTIVPEYREIIKSKYEEDISQATTPGIFEIKNRRKDGTIIDIELTDSRIYYYDKPAAMCVLRDITERKKSEEALRASEQRFRDISENSLEFIWEIDLKGIYTYASPIIEKILGYKPEELVGKKHYYDFFHPEDRDEIKKITAEIIKENKTFYEFYNRNVHKNGTTVWFSTSGIPMLDKEGKLIGYRGVDMDITQRKKIEKTLEKERQEQQIILDAAPAIIFYKDTENRFIRINKALADATGLAKEKIEGKTAFEVYPGYAEKYWQDDKEVIESGKAKLKIIEPMETTKGKVWLQTDKIPYRDAEDNIIGIIGFSADITERKKAEEELKEAEYRYRTQFEQALDAIFISDAETGILIDCNSAAAKLVERDKSEIIGKHQKILHPKTEIEHEFSRTFKQHLKDKEGQSLEAQVITKKGQIKYVSIKANRFQLKDKKVLQGIFRDITEQKKAEIELLQAQKLASVGQLAAGVAHEINNPLSALSGEIQWLLKRNKDKKLLKSLNFMDKVSARIAVIINNLLIFSKESSIKIKQLSDINSLIEITISLIGRRLSANNIRITKKLKKDIPQIMVNRGEIEQLFMNILFNSLDAMPQGGKIVISSRLSKEKDCLELIFADNGSGITKENLNKVFDPFFTTKDAGKGTGLGLYLSHGIIKKYKGSIEIASVFKKGTRLTIKLPLTTPHK